MTASSMHLWLLMHSGWRRQRSGQVVYRLRVVGTLTLAWWGLAAMFWAAGHQKKAS